MYDIQRQFQVLKQNDEHWDRIQLNEYLCTHMH